MTEDSPAAAERPAAPTAAAKRVRRPALARQEPLRHASALLRASAPAQASAATPQPPAQPQAADAAAPGEGPVALGVRLGYQVIEEQILQGQKLAQRLGRAAGQAGRKAASAAGMGGKEGGTEGSAARPDVEAGELIDRVLHLYKDIGSLCVDAVETLARSPVLRAGVARMSGASPAGTAPAAAAPARGVAVDVSCSRRVQVNLDLHPGAPADALHVHALHASDPATLPLTALQFLGGEGGAPAVLQLTVPDTQPSATYTGVVVDAASNEPRGFLTVRVLG